MCFSATKPVPAPFARRRLQFDWLRANKLFELAAALSSRKGQDTVLFAPRAACVTLSFSRYRKCFGARGLESRTIMASVLIVDDDSDSVELCAELLVSAGHRVQTGRNGAEGLKSLDRGALPDCILLDVEMPVLSGPEMAHQMRLHDAGRERIPILLVSGRRDLAEVAGRMGTPYFLAKASPDYATALLEILDRALRERRPPTDA